ncbi:hypothetical protein HK102_010215, partial [Quaeritorhiza haematococci]
MLPPRSRSLLFTLAAATIACLSHAPSLTKALPFSGSGSNLSRRGDPTTSPDSITVTVPNVPVPPPPPPPSLAPAPGREGEDANDGDGSLLQRIVAVGDLHGDLKSALEVLEMAGIINSERQWVAGNTIFVQNGDIVDRGPDTIALYELMMKLERDAADAGGK